MGRARSFSWDATLAFGDVRIAFRNAKALHYKGRAPFDARPFAQISSANISPAASSSGAVTAQMRSDQRLSSCGRPPPSPYVFVSRTALACSRSHLALRVWVALTL